MGGMLLVGRGSQNYCCIIHRKAYTERTTRDPFRVVQAA
jgi:hypothetical protein